MDHADEVGVDGSSEAADEAVTPLCDTPVAFPAGQQCDLKENRVVQMQEDGEVLLVQEIQDFQGIVSAETVVLDDGHPSTALDGMSRTGTYQQYQPVIVQGYVTSSGEVVHVVQQDAATTNSGGHMHRTQASQPQTNASTYQHCYQPSPPMIHPDLYRLIKMFPDFTTKALHRIFLLCHCDLKRALDQALFARQFRQLDTVPNYHPVAPSAISSTHYQTAPYRTPTRSPYMQAGHVQGDTEMVQMKLTDLSNDADCATLAEGLGDLGGLGLCSGVLNASAIPGGDIVQSSETVVKDGLALGPKETVSDLDTEIIKDTPNVTKCLTSQAPLPTVAC